VTVKVNGVAVVPDPGETEAPSRLPLSGQPMARTGVTKPMSDTASHVVNAKLPKTIERGRVREDRDESRDKMNGSPMDAPTMASEASGGPWERCRLPPVLW
jgi:hypothetical protein